MTSSNDDTLKTLFFAIKAAEDQMVAAEKKRAEEAAAAGIPLKELTWKEINTLRLKYPKSTEERCAAIQTGEHAWGPMTASGNSWHGPVYCKSCTACGVTWSNH